jgi:hypothetical protein
MINFKKSDNKLISLGVGQAALITKWLDEMGVTNYTINDDYTIDVEGSVDLYKKNLDRFPDYIKFGKVCGWFYCSNNKLVSLEGCPREVGGDFYCGYNNKLVNLEGCPMEVGGNFYCSYSNQLVSLEGCPREVGGSFYCRNNKKQFTEEDVREVCKVKKDIYV